MKTIARALGAAVAAVLLVPAAPTSAADPTSTTRAAVAVDTVTACSTVKKASGARVTRLAWSSGRKTTHRNLTVRTKVIPGSRKLVSKRPGKRSPVIVGCKAKPGRVAVRTQSRRYAFVLPDVAPTPEPQPSTDPTVEPSPEPVPPTAVPSVTLPGATAVAIGDSNTGRNGPWGREGQQYIPQVAWFHHAATRVGQRVRLAANFAISGTRSDEMLAQQVPQVLALSPRPAVVTVMAGTNDINQGHTAEHVINSLSATYAELADAGIKVIAGTVLPSDLWVGDKAAAVKGVNAWIRSQPVEVVDFYAALANPDGTPKAGVLMDGVHVSTVGAALMGKALAPTLERLFPPVEVFSSVSAGNLLSRGTTTQRANGTDAVVSSGFTAGDRVVAVVEFSSQAAADASTRQVEATLRGGGVSTGVFTDSDGWDGPEVVLTTIPRAGVLVSLPMRVPAGVTDLALSVTIAGGGVQVGRVALVKVG